jgi:hypothetical protein
MATTFHLYNATTLKGEAFQTLDQACAAVKDHVRQGEHWVVIEVREQPGVQASVTVTGGRGPS